MRKQSLFVLIVSALLFACCTPQKDMINYTPPGEKESGHFDPLDDSGLYAVFNLSVDPNCLQSKTGRGVHAFTAADEIYSRMETVAPEESENGVFTVKVLSSETHNYKMFLFPEGNKFWYTDEAPLHGLMIPYSQFNGTTLDQMATYPMYAEYSEATGNTLVFRDVYALIELNVSGIAQVSSIHIENKEENLSESFYLAGLSEFDTEDGYRIDKGVNFVNLNCMNKEGVGVQLSPSGSKFYLVIAPGNYTKGMTLSVSDMDHKARDYDIPAFEVKAGQVYNIGSFEYSQPDNLLLYERFDNFVWGANMRDTDNKFAGFAPDATTNLDENPTSRTGFENALTQVSKNTAGSALIQSSFTSGYTVKQRHAVSSDYIASRNIGEYNYLYRCQEFQGCLSAGAVDATRGLMDLLQFNNLTNGLYKVKVEFDIAFRYGTTDDFAMQISKSGIIRSVIIDGNPMELQTTLDGNNTYNHSFVNFCTMGRKDITPPTSISNENGWHHVEVEAWNVCETSTMIMEGASTNSALKHGFFIDNIKVYAEPMPQGNLRVLYMNIQNGMWADQPNNFDNFVAWVKKYDPDVCVWCEARTIYKSGTNIAVSSDNERVLCRTMGSSSDDGWKKLAARYGHSYHAISGFRDNFPQVITSKVPITTLGRYTDISSSKNIQHGAGLFSLTINGKTLKVVSLHLWPQLYSPSSYTLQSAAALEGRDHQVLEINKILEETNPTTTDFMLMMGDHNAISRRDAWYYEPNGLYEVVSTSFNDTPLEFTDGKYREKWYQANDAIISNGVYDDMITELWPGKFITSTGGAGRIDFIYGTPTMTGKLVNMTSIHDSWSTVVSGLTAFSLPSDHLPILADFNF